MSAKTTDKRPETGDAKSDGAANGQNSKCQQTIDPAWEAALDRHRYYCKMLGITTQETK
jgi:cation transport ATPase